MVLQPMLESLPCCLTYVANSINTLYNTVEGILSHIWWFIQAYMLECPLGEWS